MLYFDKVKFLTYVHTPVFFESGLRYKVQKTFTIEGTLVDFSATDGVLHTWTKSQILQAQAEDYQDILLNGVSFGKGKIQSISFDQGDNVREQRYTYNIVAYSEGDLSGMAVGPYEGLDWTDMKCLDRLEETFNYSLNESGDITYDHTINVRFNRDVEALGISPIQLAKDLAANFFENANLVNFLGDYNDNADSSGPCYARKTHTETYNAIDFSCSFAQRAELPANQHCTYTFSYVHNLQINEKGITTISEQGKIQGLSVPVGGSSWDAFEAECSDSDVYARVNATFEAYEFSDLDLHETIIQKAITRDKFSGTVEYQFTFTNDPRIFDYAIWDYTIQLNRSVEGYIEVSENGTVKGLGRPRVDRYQNALNFYTTSVQPSLYARVYAAYIAFGGNKPIRNIRKGISRSEYVGEISYGQTWTDNDLYNTSGGIRRQEVEIVTEYPTHVVAVVNVINEKQVIQPQNTSTVGHRRVNVKLKGARTVTIETYLAYAKALITTNSYNTIGEDPYISEARYSLSPNSNDFSLNVTLTFHGFYKAFESLELT